MRVVHFHGHVWAWLGTVENHGKKVEKTRYTLKKNREKHGKNTASKYDVFSIATHLQCPFLSHW